MDEEIRPRVVVAAPDDRGLREVHYGSRRLGTAWSVRGVRRLLRGAGCPPDIDLEDPARVSWRGGDSGTWPDRPVRRCAAAALVAAGLVGSAALLLSIGAVDAFESLTFAGRLTGWLLLVAGVVQTAAAVATVDFWGKRRWRYAGGLVLAGALIALFMSALLLGMWFQAREFIVYLPMYAALFCWSLWALWLLYGHKAWQGIPHPRGIVAGATVSAVLAGVNFSHTTLYEPNARRSIITTEAKLGEPRLSPDGKILHVPLRLSVKNVGTVPVDVLGTIFWVTGQRSELRPEGLGSEQWRFILDKDGDAERYSRITDREQLATGPFETEGSWLDPGNEHVEEKIIQIPADREYTTIDAAAKAITTRRDRGKISAEYGQARFSWDPKAPPFSACPDPGGDCVAFRARIKHNNNLVNVTRRARYVTTWWQMEPGGYNSQVTSVITPIRPDGMLEPRPESPDRYGLMRTTSLWSRVASTGLMRPSGAPTPSPSPSSSPSRAPSP